MRGIIDLLHFTVVVVHVQNMARFHGLDRPLLGALSLTSVAMVMVDRQ